MGYRIDAAARAARVFAVIAERGGVEPPSCTRSSTWAAASAAWCPPGDADAAVRSCRRRHPGAAVIGRVTHTAGVVELPGAGAGRARGRRLRAERRPDGQPRSRSDPALSAAPRVRAHRCRRGRPLRRPPELAGEHAQRPHAPLRRQPPQLRLRRGPDRSQTASTSTVAIRPKRRSAASASGSGRLRRRGARRASAAARQSAYGARPDPVVARRRRAGDRAARSSAASPRHRGARLLQVGAERLHDRVRLTSTRKRATSSPASRATSTSGSVESSLRRKHISPSRTARR